MSERTKRLSRRNFLVTVGASGAAATAAAIVGRNSGSADPEKNNNRRATRGYQASEHVQNYYRTTKV